MSFLPVSARSLHQRRVRLRDMTLRGASVFPFFDGDGEVLALMLVWPSAREIVLLDYMPGLARARFGGGVELDVDFAGLRDVCADRADGAADAVRLWHYDPWWVLRATRYQGHPAVPDLKSTNCVGAFLKPVYACHFNRDLSRLVGVTTKTKETSGLSAFDTTYQPFSWELLPGRPAVSRFARPSRGWQLDTHWLDRGWRLPALSSKVLHPDHRT